MKEDQAIILDFLPNGYPFDTRPMHKKTAIAQAIGKNHFILLELVPKKGVFLKTNDEVYIGEGKRDQVHHILGRITSDKLTETAKSELNFIVKDIVLKNEARFIEFYNKAQPINIRRHQIELLPGIGKKHMEELLLEREKEPFTSFNDIRERVKLIPDPEKAIIKRIIKELEGQEKYNLFTQ